jgi:uncharacterized repeat protein (TIGR03803 family)
MSGILRYVNRILLHFLRAPGPAARLLWPLLLAFLGAQDLPAQTFSVLHTFTNELEGYELYGGLARDGAGDLYGVSYYGGTAGYGTLFKLDARGRFTVLHNFNEVTDGGQPIADLLLDRAGNIYGTAENGSAGGGTVFKFDKHNNFSVLYSFTGGQDGATPTGLIRDAGGNIYGTTSRGGDFSCPDPVYGCGTAFKLDSTNQLIALHRFTGKPDGQWAGDGLVRDSAGNLYGTTNVGGNHDNGAVFKIDADGDATVLYSFSGKSDGGFPTAALVRDPEGNLYGTTSFGGNLKCNAPYGCGTVFKLDKNGNFTVLHKFSRGKDGVLPFHARLLRDVHGNLYGTTSGGGVSGGGTIYKLDKDGRETVLHSFGGSPDGSTPYASLIQDNAGTLYGATVFGGDLHCNAPQGCGVIFKLVPK